MTTGNTSLLGLALPVEGELDGTWGDTVNDSITSLVDSAVAGTTTLSADADVTLTDTALAANQARQAIILWTASNGATTRNITAPARSKAYAVINAGTGSIVLRGAGPTTGVTIVSGERCVAAWNGSDFVKIATSTADGVTTFSAGTTGLTPSTDTSGVVTLAGTLSVSNGGTGTTSLAANNVILGNGTSAVQVVAPGTTGNVLTSNGTTWTSAVAPSFTQIYPGAGVAVSTGTAWNTSLTAPSGALVGTTDTQTLTNKTLTDPKLLLGGTNGTSGQVPVSQGTGLAPIWGTVGAEIIRVARTSNTELTSANKSNLIAITSGTFTQTFAAASALGSGWFAYIQNSGTGDITLDPSGSETIDGLTSYIMYPGEVRLVQCDGTALRTIVLNAFYRTFTASGTFTKPPGYTAFQGFLWGAGGSGGKSSDVSFHSGGGGGGACNSFTLPQSLFGSSETITIGAGATGPSANGTSGTAGGNSTIGSLVTGFGGGGGAFGSSSFGQGVGGGGGGLMSAGGEGFYNNFSGTGGNPVGETRVADILVGNVGFGGGLGPPLNSYLKAGVYGGGGGGSVNSAGGTSLYGGGGGGSNQALTAGTSTYGGSGGAGTSSTSGVDGAAPGGGGGATRTGTKAGNGARGELRIWGII